MYDRIFGVDIGADRAIVAVQNTDDWGTIDVDLEPFPVDLFGRVGDRQPCVQLSDSDGFRLRPAHELYADAVVRSLAVAGSRLHTPVTGPVGLAVPSWWTDRATSWTRWALASRQLSEVRLVNAAEAAVIGARAIGAVVPADVLVLDLGARSCSAAVVTGQDWRVRVVPGTSAVHLHGGDTLDQRLLHRIVSSLNALGIELDRDDPDHVAAATAYLDRCREIRHDLSVRSAVTATPTLPGASQRLRIVREEFEELVVPWRNEVIRIAAAAVAQCPQPVGAVLLVGGLSTTPMIGQAMSAALDLEVIAVPDPETIVSYGAARAALHAVVPDSLWARSRARLARSWKRIAPRRAIQASGPEPLALPVGSAPIPMPMPAPQPVLEPVMEPEFIAEPVLVEVEQEPTPEPEPEPEVAQVLVPEQRSGEEDVLALIEAFAPSRPPSAEIGRITPIANLVNSDAKWVRVRPAKAKPDTNGSLVSIDALLGDAVDADVRDDVTAGR